MRAHPATNFLTPDQIRDPIGEARKSAAPGDLETPKGDLTANLSSRGHDPMPTYTRLDARSSVFFCNPCAEVR